MEDGAADVLAGKGFKGQAPPWDIELSRTQQAKQAHLAEVVGRLLGEAGVVAGNRCHKGQAGLEPQPGSNLSARNRRGGLDR
jgi:hypothetical protein